ncbi:hypothetical protein FHS14_001082 [Paenibacillus baekrokdamisoli]|nr:hypothetical protein [Paenibacillus baekrokdamisoli]
MIPMQLCFDGMGREIEILDVTQIDVDTVRMEENPIFTDRVSFGDIIKVREDKDTYHYIETLKKSKLARYTWLLTKEASESQALMELKNQVMRMNGNFQQVFGGLVIINVPVDSEFNVEEAINNIVER